MEENIFKKLFDNKKDVVIKQLNHVANILISEKEANVSVYKFSDIFLNYKNYSIKYSDKIILTILNKMKNKYELRHLFDIVEVLYLYFKIKNMNKNSLCEQIIKYPKLLKLILDMQKKIKEYKYMLLSYYRVFLDTVINNKKTNINFIDFDKKIYESTLYDLNNFMSYHSDITIINNTDNVGILVLQLYFWLNVYYYTTNIYLYLINAYHNKIYRFKDIDEFIKPNFRILIKQCAKYIANLEQNNLMNFLKIKICDKYYSVSQIKDDIIISINNKFRTVVYNDELLLKKLSKDKNILHINKNIKIEPLLWLNMSKFLTNVYNL